MLPNVALTNPKMKVRAPWNICLIPDQINLKSPVKAPLNILTRPESTFKAPCTIFLIALKVLITINFNPRKTVENVVLIPAKIGFIIASYKTFKAIPTLVLTKLNTDTISLPCCFQKDRNAAPTISVVFFKNCIVALKDSRIETKVSVKSFAACLGNSFSKIVLPDFVFPLKI
ncbi:hypothetical protein JPSP30_15550 [Staphylococcus pseudintermedius]